MYVCQKLIKQTKKVNYGDWSILQGTRLIFKHFLATAEILSPSITFSPSIFKT